MRYCYRQPYLAKTLLALSLQFNAGICLASHNAPKDALLSLSLEQLMAIDISVANKGRTPLVDSPGSVSLFTREDINALGVQELHELLRYVPGFEVHLDVISGQRNITTVRGSTGQGNDVLYLLNGVRLNDYVDSTATGMQRRLSLGNVERVEVIRGPGAALYGANAFSAVVSIITTVQINQLSLTAGDQPEGRAALNVSHAFDKWQLSLFAESFSEDGTDYHDQYDRFGLVDGRTSDPSDGQELMLSANHGGFRSQLRYSKRTFEDFYLFNGNLGDSRVYEELETGLASLGYHYNLAPELELDLQASYQILKRNSLSFITPQNAFPFSQDNFLAGPHLRHEMLETTADLRWYVSNQHTFSAGISFQQGEVPVAGGNRTYDALSGPVPVYLGGVTTQDEPRYLQEKVARFNGLFVQDEWKINQRLQLVSGLRYDDYNLAGTQFSPRLALNIRTLNEDRIKFSYSEAFRAPSLLDLYAESVSIVSNPELKAPRIISLEAGYYWNRPKLHASATLYHNEVKDAITLVSSNNNNQAIRENVSKQITDGVELTLHYPLSTVLSLRANYSYLLRNDTPLETNSPVPEPSRFQPNAFGSLTLLFQHNAWSGSLATHFNNGIDMLQDDGSQILVDLLVRYHLQKTFTLRFQVHNLADEEYYSAATGNGLGPDSNGTQIYDIPRPGRQILMGVDYQF